MQQLHHLGCDWTDKEQMFLHQGTNVLIISVDIITNVTNLKTISNVQIPSHSTVTLPTE